MFVARVFLPITFLAVGCTDTGSPPADPPAAAAESKQSSEFNAPKQSRQVRVAAAKMPAFDKPVSFDTPEADAILAALNVLPSDNPWNQAIEDWPPHPNSKAMIASVGPDKPLRYNPDMSFILVPPNQKKIEVKLTEFASESDPGPYPLPDSVPIEGWPAHYTRYLAPRNAKFKGMTLDDLQRNKFDEDSDRHAIVVDPVNRKLYEFSRLVRTERGWHAACAATFDLSSNKLRPDGWTSADAAGLPIFPAVVRHDELKRGHIEHALRVTVRKTRRAYVYPATHFASKLTDENLPRMGERIRLRNNFDTSSFTPEVKAILEALKKFGMIVADNGLEWAVSVAPDERIPLLHTELRKVKGSDFEVVTPPRSLAPSR